MMRCVGVRVQSAMLWRLSWNGHGQPLHCDVAVGVCVKDARGYILAQAQGRLPGRSSCALGQFDCLPRWVAVSRPALALIWEGSLARWMYARPTPALIGRDLAISVVARVCCRRGAYVHELRKPRQFRRGLRYRYQGWGREGRPQRGQHPNRGTQ